MYFAAWMAIEADKVFVVQNAFEVRDHMRRMLFGTLTREPEEIRTASA